jgi:hypothetical protein
MVRLIFPLTESELTLHLPLQLWGTHKCFCGKVTGVFHFPPLSKEEEDVVLSAHGSFKRGKGSEEQRRLYETTCGFLGISNSSLPVRRGRFLVFVPFCCPVSSGQRAV